MSVPLLVAGTALQMLGNYQANLAQAEAEFRNAQFYNDQAMFVKEAETRELAIASREYTYKMGAQISAAAKGGADVGSGSIALGVANTAVLRAQELAAIKRKADLDFKLARGRSAASLATSDRLKDPSSLLLQGSATAVSNYASYKEG